MKNSTTNKEHIYGHRFYFVYMSSIADKNIYDDNCKSTPVVNTAHIVRAAASMKRSGVRLSVCVIHPRHGVLQVCCCGPSEQQISVDSGGLPAARRSVANTSNITLRSEVRGSTDLTSRYSALFLSCQHDTARICCRTRTCWEPTAVDRSLVRTALSSKPAARRC